MRPRLEPAGEYDLRTMAEQGRTVDSSRSLACRAGSCRNCRRKASCTCACHGDGDD